MSCEETISAECVEMGDGTSVQYAIAVASSPAALIASTAVPLVDAIVRTNDGYLYRVAAPAATDAHITNAAGTKFYVIPSDGAYPAPAFGVADATGYQAMLDAVPEDSTILNPAGWTINLDNGITIDKRLTVTGRGLLNFTSGIAGKAGIQVSVDGTILDGLYLYNPNGLGNDSGDRPYGVEIQAHDVIVSNCLVKGFQNAIAQRANGEWYRSIIIGNQCLDCLGAGQGQASSSTLGEDRGDGITAWGAGTIIANNIVTLKDGEDGRIGIHAERLSPFIVTPGPYDDTAVSVVGNHIYGAWRRGIVFEGMRGATAVGNTIVGPTWWALAIVKGAVCCTMSDNIVYWTQGNTSWGSWSPTIAPLKLGFEMDSCILSGNTVYMKAGSKCAIGFDMQNTSDGSQTDCAMIDNKLICEDNTVEFSMALARISATSTDFPTRPVFKGNWLRGDAPDGLLMQKCVSPLVRENVIVSTAGTAVSGSAGIQLADAAITHPRIHQNHVVGWEDNIRLASITTSGSVSNNLVEGGGDGVVTGSSVSNITITGNCFGTLTGNRISNIPNAMRHLVYDNEGQRLYAETVWDPGQIMDGADSTNNFTVTGAAFGDFVEVSRESTLSGLDMMAYISAADTVTVKLMNHTGAPVDLPSTEWRILVRKMGGLS